MEILQKLIEKEKLDVNLRHPLGWTPLLVAVINNKFECVKYLLTKGADPNQSDEFTNVQSMAKKIHWHPVQGKIFEKVRWRKRQFIQSFIQFIRDAKKNFVIVCLHGRPSMVLQHFTMLY